MILKITNCKCNRIVGRTEVVSETMHVGILFIKKFTIALAFSLIVVELNLVHCSTFKENVITELDCYLI